MEERQRGRGREKRSGARKVDLPVAQLLATHSLLPAPTWKSSFTRKIRRGSKICHRRQTSKWSRPRRGSVMISSGRKILFQMFSLESFSKRKTVLKSELVYARDGKRLTFFLYYFWTIYDNIKLLEAWRKSWQVKLGAVDFVWAVFAIFDWWKSLQSTRPGLSKHFALV